MSLAHADNDTHARLGAIDWEPILAELDRDGHAVLPSVLTPGECAEVAGLYDRPERFRSRGGRGTGFGRMFRLAGI